MRWLGQVKTLSEALLEGHKIVMKFGKTFVYEKAKYKDARGHYLVCYRGWLDQDDKSKRIISIDQWREERERKKLNKI